MFAFALQFPEIDPEIIGFTVFGRHFAVTWYALAYIAGILLGLRAIYYVLRRETYPFPEIRREIIEDFFTYAIIGIILGGRLFYTLVYQPSYYLAHPLEIILPPYAGLSFHGGFIGFIAALFWVAHKHKVSVLKLGDLMALAAPIAICLVRIANFINGELWGKETDVAWAMKFPTYCRDVVAQGCEEAGAWFYYGNEVLRHPSQLYESALEGLLLGAVLWFAYSRGALRKPGLLIGIFFMGYGLARMFVEIFRNPDPQFIDPLTNPNGYVVRLGEFGLSMGQLLSLPMVLIGVGFILYSRRHVT